MNAILAWIQIQLDTYFSTYDTYETVEDIPEPKDSQHPSDLAIVYDRLLLSLRIRREELFRDRERRAWVMSSPDRRQLRHLEEELEVLDEDIASVESSRDRTRQDRS